MILANAQALVDTGLAELGYDLVQLDAGSLVARDEDTGRLVPNATLFPHGLRHLSDALRRMGLRFGMYASITFTVSPMAPTVVARHAMQTTPAV